ncbi:hypothetical protein [Aureivirga sp. CE67]|uniref:hypothetical protein n=1 Tax=Aureivirga sp. CE67 TaxID=1788983 RepID=UPI0018CAD66B|nr:hypothetical protein [Aureivirga sp. CE67]
MKKSLILNISILTILFTLQSCSKAIIEEEETGTNPPIDREVTYNQDIQNIMFNNCITCHGGPAPSQGLDLSTYENVRFSTENGNMIDRINDLSNPMPPDGLMSQSKRDLMQKWKDDGYIKE